MHNLYLAVNLSGWRIFVRRREDKAFKRVSERIFERDSYTCQYCGFQARQYQEIVNINGDYTNNKFSNMITACCFCMQCLFLESVGVDEMGGGQLVFLPEMSQADLNSFCHVLFCAMGNGTGYQDTSQAIYRGFKFRSQPIEAKFGQGTSNPAVFGQLLLELQTEQPERFSQISFAQENFSGFHHLRLLPSYTKFKIQLDAWAAAALEELAVEGQDQR